MTHNERRIIPSTPAQVLRWLAAAALVGLLGLLWLPVVLWGYATQEAARAARWIRVTLNLAVMFTLFAVAVYLDHVFNTATPAVAAGYFWGATACYRLRWLDGRVTEDPS